MFLMKLAFSKGGIPSTPIFSSYAEVQDYNAAEAQSSIDNNVTAAEPNLPDAASVNDTNEIPERYSPTMGPIYLKRRIPASYVDESNFKFKGRSSRTVIKISKQLIQNKQKFENDHIKKVLQEHENNFINNLNLVLHSLPEENVGKSELFASAYYMYFFYAFIGLYNAKINMQEIILNAHFQVAPDKPLTMFEYAILPCLAGLDFIFNLDIVNLSPKQKDYRRALADDNESGEDKDLLLEMLQDLDKYESAIFRIESMFSMMLLMRCDIQECNDLQLELADLVNKFYAINTQEQFNLPVYILSEIAMQTFCSFLMQHGGVRDIFIKEAISVAQKQANNNSLQLDVTASSIFLKDWIDRQEFFDARSGIRQDIWKVLLETIELNHVKTEPKMLTHVREALVKCASQVLIQRQSIVQIEAIVEDIDLLFTPSYSSSSANTTQGSMQTPSVVSKKVYKI